MSGGAAKSWLVLPQSTFVESFSHLLLGDRGGVVDNAGVNSKTDSVELAELGAVQLTFRFTHLCLPERSLPCHEN